MKVKKDAGPYMGPEKGESGKTVDHGVPDIEKLSMRLREEIENHRKTAENLKKSREILDGFFTGTHFLIAYLDTNSNFIRVNKAYASQWGHRPEYFEGKNYFDLYPDKENEVIFKRVVEIGDPFAVYGKSFLFPNQHRRGTTYWDWTLQPVKGEKGRVKGVILILADATERKLSEKRHLKTQVKYLEILKKSLDGFARIRPDGRFIEFNRTFKEMVGYGTKELLQMTCRDITPDKWHHMESEMLAQAMKNGHSPYYEKEFLKKNGSLLPVEVLAYGSADEEDATDEIWIFTRDMTNRKQAESEQKTHLEMLEHSNKELEEFAYVTSHDLQEPLRKIQTFGNRLNELYGATLDEHGRDYLRRMVNAAARMRTLIDALLAYSRIATKENPFRPVDLNEVVREVLSNLETRIQETGGTVAVQVLPTLEADYQQMLQLMQNLVGNALKFKQQDMPPRIWINAETKKTNMRSKTGPYLKEGLCVLRIEDNGIGFKQENAKQIFDPFQRLHGRSEFEGVGMGLAICKKIVQRHGGTIEANSTPGRGTIFTINLPLIQTGTTNGHDKH